MREIRSNIAALSTQMAAIMEEVKRNRIDRYRAQSLSLSPRKAKGGYLLLHSYFFETMYIGDKGLAQVSRVAPLEFKASLFPRNVTRFSPVGDPNFGHSLLFGGSTVGTRERNE
jgi:hypothetical protein